MNLLGARLRAIALAAATAAFTVTAGAGCYRLAHAATVSAQSADAPPVGTGIRTVMMDPHMQLTIKRDAAAGDSERADAIVAAARALMTKYADVKTAEADGYTKFLPGIPLPTEHFTSRSNALLAAVGSFDPNRPTSLIYTRNGSTLTIAGVMYTAPNRASAADLDAKVPMSVGAWHRHVNFCKGPAGLGRDPRFGFEGTLADRASCEAAGGTFIPLVFNWMLHVWPNESTSAEIWNVEHGHDHDHGMGMIGAPHAFTSLPIAPDKLPTLHVPTGDANRGANVFAANCASCHGTAGRNGPDAPTLANSGLQAGQVAYMIRHPRDIDATSAMPALPISDADVADVSAYVAALR
jgi:mono/diheme cytochrome c family protein